MNVSEDLGYMAELQWLALNPLLAEVFERFWGKYGMLKKVDYDLQHELRDMLFPVMRAVSYTHLTLPTIA